MAEPGDLYMAPVPRCELHGEMRYVPEVTAYVCHGYDGEGCHAVDPADLDWTHIGTAGPITFTAPLDSPNTRIALGGDAECSLLSHSGSRASRWAWRPGPSWHAGRGGDPDAC